MTNLVVQSLPCHCEEARRADAAISKQFRTGMQLPTAGRRPGAGSAVFGDCGNLKELKRLHLLDCMECGCCAYKCPGKLPLVEQFRRGKGILRAAQAEQKAKEEKK